MLQSVMEAIRRSRPVDKRQFELKPFAQIQHELTVNHGILLRGEQIIPPTKLRLQILKRAHEGHPGVVRMKRLLRSTYWWPGMDAAIKNHVKFCLPCQDSAKSHKVIVPDGGPIEKPDRPWSKLAIDITGPFANAPFNQRYIVVVLDYYSSYPEVLLTGDTGSARIIKWLTEVFDRFGNPDTLVSDNGSSFVSNVMKEFLSSRDVRQECVPLYEPRRNGKVEVFNRTLKHAAQTFEADHMAFDVGVQRTICSYRATPNENGQSPAKLLLGRDIRNNIQPRRATNEAKPITTAEEETTLSHRRTFRQDFKVGELVRIRLPHVPKGRSPYTSPFRIDKIVGNFTYQLDNGKIWTARNLVPFRRPPPAAIEVQSGELRANQPPRRSGRHNKGVPLDRWIEHI